MGERAPYRVVFERCGVPLLILKAGTIVDVNEVLARRLGYAPAALRDRDAKELGIELHDGGATLDTATGAKLAARIWVETVEDHTLVTFGDVREVGGVEHALQTRDTPALSAFERRLGVQRELGTILAGARDIATTLPLAIAALCEYDQWDGAAIWLPATDGTLQCLATWLRPELAAIPPEAAPLPSGPGREMALLRRVIASGRAEKLSLATPDPDHGTAYGAGLRLMLGTPVFLGTRVLGVVALASLVEGSLEIPEIGLLESVGQMLGLYIERTRAEASLRAQEQRLQQVIDTLHEGLMLIDETGSVLYFNPRAQEHYGFTTDDDTWRSALYDRGAFETRTLAGTLVPPEQRPSARIREGELVRDVELWVTRTATGTRRALSFSGARLREPDGRQISVLAFSDITARVESTAAIVELNDSLEQRVEARTAELASANAELEAFSYSVSHDLRAPVRSITSFSQIIVDDFDDQLPVEARRMLARVHTAGVRLGHLVDDLLAFSQLGRHALRCRTVELDPLVRGVVDQVAGEDARRLDLELATLGTCEADASLIEQVWINLIDNAFKYSRTRDRIRLCITRQDRDAEAVFTVADNGVGFDMSYVDKLFGVFQRLHSSEAFEGTGVGLANVRRIVERHGGRVAARSMLDAGSTFEFTLPLRR
ncbi:MAG: ATP-binding protein [Kofleriaceae bacterium]